MISLAQFSLQIRKGLRNRSLRHALALGTTIILATIIAYLTLTPGVQKAQGVGRFDKLAHLFAFAVLIIPSAFCYRRSLSITLPASLIFGGAIELIQPSVGRSADVMDFIADLFGIGVGLAAGLAARELYFVRRRKNSMTS